MGIGRKFVTFAAVVGLTVIGGGFATAAESGTHTVTYQVVNTRSLTLSNTGTIALGTITATDGTGKTASGGTVTYSTDSASDKIVAALDENTETGVTLQVSAGTPSSGSGTEDGTAQSNVALSTSEANVITLINNYSGGVSALTYKVTTSGATPTTSQSKVVTYAIKAT